MSGGLLCNVCGDRMPQSTKEEAITCVCVYCRGGNASKKYPPTEWQLKLALSQLYPVKNRVMPPLPPKRNFQKMTVSALSRLNKTTNGAFLAELQGKKLKPVSETTIYRNHCILFAPPCHDEGCKSCALDTIEMCQIEGQKLLDSPNMELIKAKKLADELLKHGLIEAYNIQMEMVFILDPELRVKKLAYLEDRLRDQLAKDHAKYVAKFNETAKSLSGVIGLMLQKQQSVQIK